AAIAQYQALLDINPKDVAALNNVAIAYQQDQDKRALESAEKAKPLAPQNAPTLDPLGWILVEQGDTAKGLPHLRKALELAPNMTEVRYHYAQALLKSGDKAGARSELEKVVQQGGNFSKLTEAKALLGTLWYRLNETAMPINVHGMVVIDEGGFE